MILLGVGPDDEEADADYLVRKILNMRIFPDEADKMNLSVLDRGGDVLVVSQFTLFADTKKGNRPSFNGSALPEMAIPLYEYFVVKAEELLGKPIPTGEFGAKMEVDLVNDGPCDYPYGFPEQVRGPSPSPAATILIVVSSLIVRGESSLSPSIRLSRSSAAR